jgi:hypothetical protein
MKKAGMDDLGDPRFTAGLLLLINKMMQQSGATLWMLGPEDNSADPDSPRDDSALNVFVDGDTIRVERIAQFTEGEA